MELVINGQVRVFGELPEGAGLDRLMVCLNLKGDRVAVEHNGVIVARADWANSTLSEGDKLEIVHFVGGGSGL